MVSIIKNQLLKHLSRFTKNLSADQINLSTLRGEGELTNLELDETVLTDLLELPSWLKLTSAWCNKVNLRIQWTKLKSVPIFLNLDEVQIEVVTCEDLRSPSSIHNPPTIPHGSNKYSFIHKVIDGMTISVNTVSVTFKSPAFIASVQISRILVESKSPTWQRCDLRMTRVKDADRGQLLIFKELEWQTVRIEAQSTKDKDLTPLRLLTNQARCRITIKKRLLDCFVMGSRLVIILDDLLWVLTDSQLKAALHFIDSLSSLIEEATIRERKFKAARKLEVLPEYQAQISQQSRSKAPCNSAISKIFMRYDVIETSYHFLSQRIDLHLCDDPGVGRSSHPDLKDGGALQISLVKFQVDYYPYHLAMADRKHWAKYRENVTPHAQWLQQSLNSFRGQFMNLINHGQKNLSKNPSKQSDDAKLTDEKNKLEQQNSIADPQKKPSYQPGGNSVKNYVLEQLSTLMTTCVIIRIQDFTIYKVTTSTRKPVTKEFITGDRDKFSVPEDVTIVHAEFTYYYYPGDLTFPLPPPKFYVQLNPLLINYDIHSCIWFNSFILSLYQSLKLTVENKIDSATAIYFDVKLEAICLRIVLEASNDYPNQRDRPKSVHFQTSRILVTNVRSSDKSSRSDLAECLNAFKMGQMFFSTGFPSQESDFHVITEKLLQHSAGIDNVRDYPPNFSANTIEELTFELNKKLLWLESKDVWCCTIEPIWADFFGAKAVGSQRAVPFLDAFPVTIWLHMNEKNVKPSLSNSESYSADIHGLAFISNLVSIQINHYQYLFLLRQLEFVSEMSTYVILDSKRILNNQNSCLAIGALIPQIEVTLIMPSPSPGKENSGGDLESVVPDSSSIAEDILGSHTFHNSTMTARLEFGSKRLNTSADIETPQSEACSMTSIDVGGHPSVVTFKSTDKNDFRDASQPLLQHRRPPDDLELKQNIKLHQRDSSAQLIPNNFNMGLSNMKKSFANLMTSIDSALKASPEDGSSDTVSMRSDISSDSENYIVVTLEDQEKVDSAFDSLNVTGITTVEEASEVVEETPDTQSEKSLDSTCKRKDLVSMITFKLSKVEMIHQSSGFSSCIKVQVSRINSEECSSIPWDEFQSKFTSRSRDWVELQSNDCKISVKLRLDHGLKPELTHLDDKSLLSKISSGILKDSSITGLFEDKIKAEIADVSLTMSMSYISGLLDLIEDEILADPIPMEAFLKNINICLNEDRPSNNITSPGPVPIFLKIKQLFMVRDKAGFINLDSVPFNLDKLNNSLNHQTINNKLDKELNELKNIKQQLENDNNELKRRLMNLEHLFEENSKLRRHKDEVELIRLKLNDAEDYIKELINQKSVLQETAAVLQKQLNKTSNTDSSNKTSSWSIKR